MSGACNEPEKTHFPNPHQPSVGIPLNRTSSDKHPAAAGNPKTSPIVWIANDVTDFALDPAGSFFWENKRQTLKCRHGGQLSRLGYYVRYNDVKVDPLSLRKLIAWIDTNCPYRGEEDIRAIPDPEFAGIDQLPIRPKVATAPIIQRP